MNHTVYIGIGSNLGNREQNCQTAIDHLQAHPHVIVKAVSKWYETEAQTIDSEEQPKFINGAVKIVTDLQPEELLNFVKEVEHKMGRTISDARWQPRTIDLDLLFYNNTFFENHRLTIPHPQADKRSFVLEPLCDIDENLVHPIYKKTVKELLNSRREKK
ncbi:MAG: 2-amino-4-hydroxy-6-hydroxymethyldihydropteridine diphosphokinase [Pseudomonadota bacterium]